MVALGLSVEIGVLWVVYGGVLLGGCWVFVHCGSCWFLHLTLVVVGGQMARSIGEREREREREREE